MLKELLGKIGLSPNMIMLSLKGALPPTIAIAAYQAPAWARIYSTSGYFVAIIAFLSMAIQPRAKFFQSIFTNTIFICVTSALNLLVIQCAIAARDTKNNQNLHTGASGSIEATSYDSSANAVAATWLFFVVFASNYLRAKRPQLAVPAIQSNIYSITAAIYAPAFPNITSGMDFSRRLLTAFLTAYGIAAAVNVFVWPTTSRGEVKRQSVSLIDGLKECIQTYKCYTDSFDKSAKTEEGSKDQVDVVHTLRDQCRGSSQKFGKLKLDLEFARKEVAYGKLRPEHLHDFYVGMREVLQPIMGLTTFLEIIACLHHEDDSVETTSSSRILEAVRDLKENEWSTIITTFRDPHGQLLETMTQGLDHISIQLGLVSRPKVKQVDVEDSSAPQPGQSSFSKYLKQELNRFQTRYDRLVQEWLDTNQPNLQRGDQVSRTLSDESGVSSSQTQVDTDPKQHHLYLILYLNFLVYNTGQAILRQVRFADGLVNDGSLSRNRLIFPGLRSTGSLMMGAFMDPGQDEAMGMTVNNGSNIWVGDLFNCKKDPEHLTPANFYERMTNGLRRIPRSLSSSHASFGLRCAVATLSVALAGFLKQSRPFFLEQRGIWAASTTAIAMSPQFGTSVSAFAMRSLGTAVAAGLSIAISYIADHNIAGIIVLLYFVFVGGLMIIARFPSFESAGIIGTVAVVVIVGYQLQVYVIGIAKATSNGEEYYPVYLLAPYRLVAILAGIGVAFFWSFFPFPVTSHGSLRQDTANALYILANYHSCVHATVKIYLRFGPEVNKLPADHPVNRLEEARQEVFGKSILMLGRLRDHLHASRFEPRIGGKFPREQYEKVIESLSHIFTYLALMTYASKAFIRDPEYSCATNSGINEQDDAQDEQQWLMNEQENTEAEEQWLRKFRSSVAKTEMTSQKLTSTLCLLASSIHNGQPLPPYLALSRHSDPTERLVKVASELSDTRHLSHPCYAAFAVNEITASLINGEMEKLVKLIKDLVGEIDFSFHIMSTSDDSTSTLIDHYAYEMDSDEKPGLVRKNTS